MPMMMLRPFVILCGACAMSVLAHPADAASKPKRIVKHVSPAATRAAPPYQRNPARMIEVRPGRWISSWGCSTDEGYGRIGTCDRREGPD
jgi:hypothetical protein